MKELITQAESRVADDGGRYFGGELFYDPTEGYYTARFHCRTYDGIKVASSHTTGEIRLESTDASGAHAELRQHFHEFVGLYRDPA